jgi:hypothetical protein
MVSAGKGDTVPTEDVDENAVSMKKSRPWTFSRWWRKSIKPMFVSKPPKVIKSFDIKRIFWDVDGNLRQGTTERSREEEVLHILEHDSGNDENIDQVWIIIPSRWVRNWLLFAYHKMSKDPPGPVDISSLIKEDATVDGGWRPKNTLLPPTRTKVETGDYAKIEWEVKPGNYRRIPFECWELIVGLYGQTGPQFCIAVKGNSELTPASDVSRWRIFQDPLKLDSSILPVCVVVDKEEVKKEEREKRALFSAMGMSG